MDLQHSFPGAMTWLPDRRSSWSLSIAMVVIGIGALFGLFWDTAASAVKIWWEKPTYSYAFLILPITAYLVWQKREEVRAQTPTGSLSGAVAVATFAVLWLISEVAEINEGRHIAFVGMVSGILLACLGWQIFKILCF